MYVLYLYYLVQNVVFSVLEPPKKYRKIFRIFIIESVQEKIGLLISLNKQDIFELSAAARGPSFGHHAPNLKRFCNTVEKTIGLSLSVDASISFFRSDYLYVYCMFYNHEHCAVLLLNCGCDVILHSFSLVESINSVHSAL